MVGHVFLLAARGAYLQVASTAEMAAHGMVYGHGILDLDWVASHRVGVPLAVVMSCNTGNLSYSNNFVSSVFYRPTNDVVLALGQTNLSGGLGTSVDGFYAGNLAQDLAAGKAFGTAFLEHINADFAGVLGVENREWLVSIAAFWGDLTLRLQEFHTAPCE